MVLHVAVYWQVTEWNTSPKRQAGPLNNVILTENQVRNQAPALGFSV
jgi:hypothetical protein